VISVMEKHTIITLKNQGKSLRQIAKDTGFSRRTVTRYWNEYQKQVAKLGDCDDIRIIQEAITQDPRYDTSTRQPVKYNSAIDIALDDILAKEDLKCVELGLANKQKLTQTQIHALLVSQGFDIGRTTVGVHISAKRKAAPEAFIRQAYDPGDRLEYDFGSVKLLIAGSMGVYHLAVFASPAGKFRWAYLYTDQKKEAFIDSHIRFFAWVGGVWKEIVYDNMKNVVSKFIGKNDKELNSDLVKMSLYYGFQINVANCFAGHEKGYVESAVKWIRNHVFAEKYSFNSIEEARDYLAQRLTVLNADSTIEAERLCLLPPRPPLEIARISEHVVDKYSFIKVLGNYYSVPDHLVGNTLTVKSYPDEIVVFSGFIEVCRHHKLSLKDGYSVDIFHYLDTLIRKPQAVKNSVALRSKTELKMLFDEQYSDRPRDFITKLMYLKDHPINEIVAILSKWTSYTAPSGPVCSSSLAAHIQKSSQDQLQAWSAAFLKSGDKLAC